MGLPPTQQARLSEMCCSSYDSAECWPAMSSGEYIYDMHPFYLRCCFPSLKRMLQISDEALKGPSLDASLSSSQIPHTLPIAWARAAAYSALGQRDVARRATDA